MVILHNAFRREFGLFPALVTTVAPGDRNRARLVASHLDLELTALHDHHQGEDRILWPELLKASAAPLDLVRTMEAQHDRLDGLLAAARAARAAWLTDPDVARREELGHALAAIGPVLGEHLDLEEARILPLVERFLTQADWQRLGDESRRRLPRDPRRQLILLGALLEDADGRQRRVIDAEMPAAARLLWRSVGRPLYRRYVKRLRGPLTSTR